MSKRSAEDHVARLLSEHPADLPAVRKAVILGWSLDGIGGEIGHLLGGQDGGGWDVICLDKSGLDVRDYDQVDRIMKREQPGALIYVAGLTDLAWFECYRMSRVQDIFDVNVLGAYNAASAFVRATSGSGLRHRRKYITFVGSMAATIPLNGSAPYCASKAALAQLSRCITFECAPRGYNVLTVQPSNVAETPMEAETIANISAFRGISVAEAEDYWRSGMIRHHLLSKGEVARLVSFFVNGQCDYLGGAVVPLMGGNR